MAADRTFDILVIGAGPAGIAAALAASESGRGRSIGLVDDNPAPGGQIWRGGRRVGANKEAADWFARLDASRVEVLGDSQVLGPTGPGRLLADLDGRPVELAYDRLILATGARELFLPFPGWTLPNVTGAGGLQALVKSGLPIAGKRVVVAGSGPLLLAVAASLKRRGADVRLVAEQAPLSRLARFASGLWREPDKLRQAVRLRWALGPVPYRAGCWPERAEGSDRVESVTVTDGRTSRRVACDTLACGFGLVPNLELATAIGCATGRGGVSVDAWGRTTVVGVYAAGEIAGIGGLARALIDGRIVGHVAAGDEPRARELAPAARRAAVSARRLDRAFALRPELAHLAESGTIVCRCEDVRHGSLVPYKSWLDAKLQTRCGMGPCQGRVCGPVTEFLYGWPQASVRPPIFPADLGHLATRPPA